MAETLREYLVALGWKIDEDGLRKFNLALGGTGKNVAQLGAAVVGTTSAIVAGVERVASEFEQLYYASQRTGTTVGNLKALEFAGRQVGLSADQARGAAENLARTLNTSPGSEGLLNYLGVQTRTATGGVRQMNDVLLDLVGRLKSMPTYIAAQYAQIFGLDYTTLQQLENNLEDVKKAQAEQHEMMARAGLDADDLAAKSHGFMQELRKLGEQWDVYGAQIEKNWIGPATSVVKAGQDIIGMMTDLGKATDGWSNKMLSVAAAFGGFKTIGAIFSRIFGGAAAAAGAEGAAAAGMPALAPLAAGAVGTALSLDQANKDLEKYGVFMDLDGNLFPLSPGEKSPEAKPSAPKPSLQSSASQAGMAKYALDYFMAQGWTREQAAGIVANLQRESGFNPFAIGDHGQAFGLAQWHPDRQAAFRRWAGHDITRSTVDEQFAFIQYELTHGGETAAGRLLRATKTAREAGVAVSSGYVRPGDALHEGYLRGNLAQSIFDRAALTPAASHDNSTSIVLNQKTDINVNGGDGARDTADAVAAAQARVNADMRNVIGAVR